MSFFGSIRKQGKPPAIPHMALLTPATMEFMQTLGKAMDPNLSMYLLREQDQFALFVGLWGMWWLNETNRRAKVVFVMVLKESSVAAPLGPLPFGQLVPWLVLQLHVVDEENPIWEDLQKTLSKEFTKTVVPPSSSTKKLVLDSSHPSGPSRLSSGMDPSLQDNHLGRTMSQPEVLTEINLQQTKSATSADARPRALINQRVVE